MKIKIYNTEKKHLVPYYENDINFRKFYHLQVLRGEKNEIIKLIENSNFYYIYVKKLKKVFKTRKLEKLIFKRENLLINKLNSEYRKKKNKRIYLKSFEFSENKKG